MYCQTDNFFLLHAEAAGSQINAGMTEGKDGDQKVYRRFKLLSCVDLNVQYTTQSHYCLTPYMVFYTAFLVCV